MIFIWDKVFKNRPSGICGRQPLKYLKSCFLFELKNGNTKRMYEICSKLTRKTPERRLKQISQIVPVFPTVDFEQINGGWMVYIKTKP